MLVLSEHADEHEVLATHTGLDGAELLFSKGNKGACVQVREVGTTWRLTTSYYVGAGWLRSGELAVQVQPKLNSEGRSLDHLAMLFTCLSDSSVAPHVAELYELDTEAAPIALPRQDDLLTPILIGHFLHLVREVVRQGLRKSYNPVKRELRGRVKGKIEVSKTLRQGTLRGRPLVVACAYEEFSFDIPENRLLKQALRFAGRYLQDYPAYEHNLAPLLRYCEPAFAGVGEEYSTSATSIAVCSNPLYRSYDEALRVGLLLLKRFGFSMQNVEAGPSGIIHVPPHWIDMALLFELYVLGMLREKFGHQAIAYGKLEAKAKFGLPDFLFQGVAPWIIDTKYKPQYKHRYLIEDVRQISGYARDRGVLAKLGFQTIEEQDEAVVRCLIVYPQQLGGADVDDAGAVVEHIPDEADLERNRISSFTRFYKLAVRLPERLEQVDT